MDRVHLRGQQSGDAGRSSYSSRVRQNIADTNRAVPGFAAPTGLGLVLGAGRTVGRAIGMPTIGQAVMGGTSEVVVEGVAYSAVEAGILGAFTSAATAVVVGGAFEGGVVVGSAISAAVYPCR